MTSQPCNGKSFVQTQTKIWTSQWSVILRTFYRQILSLLYGSFFFWNFRHRLARELLGMNHSPSEHLQHRGKGGKRIPEYQKSTTHAAFQMPWGSVEGRCHAHGSHKVSHTVVLCGACSINTSAFLMKHCQKAKENWETCWAHVSALWKPNM